MSDDSWERALDALEERLRRQEAVVDGRSQDIVAGGLPVTDGPLPEHLRTRAQALLQRTRELEARGHDAMVELREAMQRRSATGANSPYASSNDRPGRSHDL